MNFTIKNQETQRRATELARVTGETVADAVDRAIVERLERKRDSARRAKRSLAIGRECARLPILNRRTSESVLYNRRGRPK